MSAGYNTKVVKLWTLTVVAISCLVVGSAWQKYQERSSRLESARITIGQLLYNVEASTQSTFESARLLADHIGTITVGSDGVYDGVIDNREIGEWQRLLADQSFISAVAFIAPDGAIQRMLIRDGSGTFKDTGETRSVANLENFSVHLTNTELALFVGRPTQSLINGAWYVTLTRSIRAPDDTLLGVVFIGVLLETFMDLYANVLPPSISSLVMYRDTGEIIFTYPFMEDRIGTSSASTSLFETRIPANPEGTYQAISPTLGDERLLSYRVLTESKMVLAIDAALSNILRTWYESLPTYFLVVGLASAALVVLAHRLTRQLRQEEATRKSLWISEQSLETSQQMAGVGHFVRDVKTGEFLWADNMYRIHGLTPEDFTPDRHAFLDLIVDEDWDRTQEQVYHPGRGPKDGHLECRIRRFDDGEIRDMIYDWQVIRDKTGAAQRVFGVAQDVTELRASERATRDNEARLRDITECMSDFVWETDANGVVTHFESGSNDPQIEVVLGVTKDQNVDFDADTGDWQRMRQAMEREEPVRNFVLPLRNASKETRWIRVSGNPMYDASGTLVGWRGAGTDVTEQRQQTLSLSEKRKNEALSRMTGGLAHEINNLLQPVLVYSTEGEGNDSFSDRARSHFQKIYSATQQAMDIVGDALTFSRERQAEPQSVDLARTIKTSLDLIAPTLPSHVVLEDAVAAGDDRVDAQTSGIHQVLLNLINNAVDAAGSDAHIVVETGTMVVSPTDADRGLILPGRYGYLKVTDNGAGIDESALDKIFDPFFTTKPVGSGTGLGLSVAAGLVREWGGTIDVASHPGRTVFTVYMPLSELRQQAAE